MRRLPPGIINLYEAAGSLGLTAQALQGRWQTLVREEDLPPPVSEHPLLWSAEALATWRRDRSRRAIGRVEIPLTRGQVAIVDAADLGWLSAWPWHAVPRGRGKGFYAVRNGRVGKVWMHRAILGAPDDRLVDHRDGDGLHNWRRNLRLATCQQNVWNRSLPGMRGVTMLETGWRASITVEGKRLHLGVFDSPEGAALAYDTAALELRGEFARLNYPSDFYPRRRARR